MKKFLVAGIAVAAFCAAPALAADRPMPYKAAPAAPVFSWTGLYVGAHAGADWFNNDWAVPLTAINIAGGCPGCPTTAGGHSDSSWLAGTQIGFNYQTGTWVWGIEGDFSWTRLNGAGTNTFIGAPFADHSKTDWLGTLAARVGMAWDRSLLYVKGGGAWAHDKFYVSTTPGGPPSQLANDTRSGWMVGVGWEYAFSPNWSVKAEYDYLDFGRKRETLQVVPGGGAGAPFQYDIKQTINLVKVGINYKFGGPLVANY